MKKDLRDTTFLIPIRIDSIIRVENMLVTIRYILDNFYTKVIVVEAASYNNGILSKLLGRKVQYVFFEDRDPVFHRTRYLNCMTNKIDTLFIAIWDTDVILDKKQIMNSVLKLRERKADIVYPYDGHFYDTSSIIRKLFLVKQQITLLHKYVGRMSLPYGSQHRGGAFIADTKKYKQAGMENENFYGWGPEDFERFERWKNMGLKIYFESGNLFHLTHPRDINGRFSSERQMEMSNLELVKTRNSSAQELNNNS